MNLKKIIKSNYTILENMASLSLLQMANYLIPILVLPFIVRDLGVEMIGKISYAQNIIQYFTIFITYGFEYSATREIAIHKNNHEKTKQIFWSVIVTKILLLTISFFCLLVLSACWGRVQEDIPLYLCLFAVNIGFTFFPTWFFQGIEKMKSMAIVNFLIKSIGTGMSVFFIHAPEDYLVFAYMPSSAHAILGFAAFIYVIRKYKLSSVSFVREEFFTQNKKAFPIFLNTLFTTLYTIANTTILGLFVNDYDLGIYSGAYKIIMCILMVTSMPINLSIFPSIGKKMEESKKEGLKLFKRMGIYVVLISILFSGLTWIFAPILVKILLGAEFLPCIPILKVFSCLPFLVITASLCTVQGLYGLGFQKYAPIMGLIVGSICIFMNFQFIPLWGMYGAAISWIISQFLEILISGGIVLFMSKKIMKSEESQQ